ncbi:MAG: ribosome biogenesis GTP-binding protein YihA/YsxC, partial [Candidatus Adiutrix sp.]
MTDECKQTNDERPPALQADFVISAAAKNQFPPPGPFEIALLGRSNAGKSSLMNRWLGRKSLARVGATPGRTRLINFFNIVWHKKATPFILTDLPGYGFAAAPKNMVAGWRRLVSDYLEARRPIKMALLIMDIRRDPQE